MLGGLGGAMAGNWIYDQMSGRHHHRSDAGLGPDPGVTDQTTPANDDWGGGDGGMSWGNDAGGGGSDWGGGGSDWGGGGGGGDWGGGGDGGGSW
jgi:uncharacterized protein